MAIKQETVIAEASVNNSYGIEVYQRHQREDYTTDDARAFAAEILAAADDADRLEQMDRDAAFAGEVCTPIQFPDTKPDPTIYGPGPVR